MVVPRKKKTRRREKMPEYWQRLGRPESERIPERREKDYARAKTGRRLDESRGWRVFGESLEEIERSFGIGIRNRIEREIQNYTEERPFKVLDIGCGPGTSLKELKEKFGNRIKTVGVVLAKVQGEKYSGVDRLVEGNFKEVKLRETYDLIYDYLGAFGRIREQASAAEKVLGLLKPGGLGAFDIGARFSVTDVALKELRTVLRQNGVKKFLLKENSIGFYILVFRKPVIKFPK